MGEKVAATEFSRADRQRYRDKVKRCLDVFARMLSESRFDAEHRSIGLEIELNLTDEAGDPAFKNAAALEAIADEDFQTELGQFNVEINIAPRLMSPTIASELEADIRRDLNEAEEKARGVGAHMVMVGILPTLQERHLNAAALSANPRYELLNQQIFAARGEDLQISISGAERLSTYADTIAPEAACTSVQLHQQIHPAAFARHWNAAQCVAGIQLAVGANSPFFFGKELWRETRLHNGTIYRWNRPVYAVVRGRPHLRVENRVLPAGPTVADIVANAAFYYGLIRALVDEDRPIWSRMSFSAAEDNFHRGARDGLDAHVYWPGVGEAPAAELVLRRLLPMAHEGLERFGMDTADRERLLA